jgi:toxin YoeB
MGIHFDDNAWHQYFDWQHLDRKTLKKINALLTSIRRNGYQSIGKVEKLKGDLSGFYSVRIDDKNRLVFYIRGDDIVIASCSGHYGDK